MDAADMNTKGAFALSFAIITQAIEDWKDLEAKNAARCDDNKGDRGAYSYKDIEKFFLSEWCDVILYAHGIKITGRDIVRMLKKEEKKAG